jgi:hypothetical protein
VANEKDYMPTQAGLSLGDRGDQVERLQEYLMRYGYLESRVAESFGPEPVPGFSAPAPEERGVFDENTDTALMRFQSFNHLPVTGELDQATVDLMGQPRCGVPDNVEFVNTGRRWPTTNLTYAFQGFTPDLPEIQTIDLIEQAFALWSAETQLCFRQVELSAAPDITIRFVAGSHEGDVMKFDGPGGELAHAFLPPEPPPPPPLTGDVHFDEDETWSGGPHPQPFPRINLTSVAAHEFGHSLGLGHSSGTGGEKPMMYPFYPQPRFLTSNDIAGIQAIYGAYPIAHASWIHGSSVAVMYPDQLETFQRTGYSTNVAGQPGTGNAFHFAIPTPVIVNDDRKVVGPVILRFGKVGTEAVVQHVEIRDGPTLIANQYDVNLSSAQLSLQSVKFGVPHCPPAEFGLNITVFIDFGGGSVSQRRVQFISAGCHFRP